MDSYHIVINPPFSRVWFARTCGYTPPYFSDEFFPCSLDMNFAVSYVDAFDTVLSVCVPKAVPQTHSVYGVSLFLLHSTLRVDVVLHSAIPTIYSESHADTSELWAQ